MVIQMEINVKELLDVKIRNEVVVFQTDTVYGIGALLASEKGVKKIYQMKSRENKKPLAVLCANIGQVKTLVQDFKSVEQYANKHWPGALTLVLKKTDLVGDFITSGFDTVGVRIPKDEIALQILEKFGPMAVTSLNISSEPAILKYSDALKFNKQVDYIVKGKDLNSISSTVYDCVNKRVLRQGDISL
jgi:L-threonylcarbamoyladenylate synthase